MISRRKWMVGAAAAAHALAAQPKGLKGMANVLADASRVPGRPDGILIESHIHLFAGDPARFPYNSASYQPHTAPVEGYVKFAHEAQINHAVIGASGTLPGRPPLSGILFGARSFARVF